MRVDPPSSHKAVNLVREPLDNVLSLDALLPLGDRLLVLILGWKHGVWDGDTRSITGVYHGRVACGGSLEWCARLRGEVDDLAAPAETDDTPFLDVAVLALDLLQDFGDALDSLWWCTCGLEELAELLSLLVLLNVRR